MISPLVYNIIYTVCTTLIIRHLYRYFTTPKSPVVQPPIPAGYPPKGGIRYYIEEVNEYMPRPGYGKKARKGKVYNSDKRCGMYVETRTETVDYGEFFVKKTRIVCHC